MIALRKVDRSNWHETLPLAVQPDQQKFITDYAPIAAIALAKAYVGAVGCWCILKTMLPKTTCIKAQGFGLLGKTDGVSRSTGSSSGEAKSAAENLTGRPTKPMSLKALWADL